MKTLYIPRRKRDTALISILPLLSCLHVFAFTMFDGTGDIDGDGCGPSSTDLKQLSEEEALKTYFAKGYTNAQLCTVLQHAHGIDLTLDQVKKRLAKLGLRRRGPGTQPPLQMQLKSDVNTTLNWFHQFIFEYIWASNCFVSRARGVFVHVLVYMLLDLFVK